MSDSESADQPTPEGAGHDEIPPPTGTIFFVTLYLMAMAGMWGAIYILMLQR